jgi:cysteine-rich repeat protein
MSDRNLRRGEANVIGVYALGLVLGGLGVFIGCGDPSADDDADVGDDVVSDVDVLPDVDVPLDVDDVVAEADGDTVEETEIAPVCGNGILEDGEECDDGDDVGGDGCEGDCTVTSDPCGGCPAGMACAGFGPPGMIHPTCVVPCLTGLVPGDAGFRCHDEDPPGPSDGDEACWPGYGGLWLDGTRAGGYCQIGVYPGGSGVIGVECGTELDCSSPLGLGSCMWLGAGRSFCSVACNEELAEEGICESSLPGEFASGLCRGGFCLQSCSAPDAPLGENGCAGVEMACYAIAAADGDYSVAAGRLHPAGFCWPACRTEGVDCGEIGWEATATCEAVTGICRAP